MCLQFGLITFSAIVVINMGFGALFPQFFNHEQWVVWKEIAFTLVNFAGIGMANTVLMYYTYFDEANFWLLMLNMQAKTLALGIFPVLFYVYYDQLSLYKKYMAEAHALNESILSSNQRHGEVNRPIIFKNEKDEVEFQWPEEQVYCIKSDGNYLELYVWENDTLTRHLLRNRIKTVEKFLTPSFFRCHRSYIVNTNQIRKVTGNARGYELYLEGLSWQIPVSRNAADALQKVLN